MIKNDEDYLIRRTYTNYGGRKMEEGYKELLSIEKEKTADEMFKELGYRYEERKYADVYIKDTKDLVRQFGFNKTNKSIMIDVHYFTMQELQAINKKVLELRMVK